MAEKKIRTKDVDQLLRALISLDDVETLYAFLRDVCTVRELREIAQRFEVAKQLANGVPYSVIQKATGASATTIARVSKCLNYGEDGYHHVLEAQGLLTSAAKK
jgi:TrpR-related protein YerC/YecD